MRGQIAVLALLGVAACASRSMVASPPPATSTAPAEVQRDYSRLEAEALSALNSARTSPPTASGWLDELSHYYAGNRVLRPGTTVPIVTNEGLPAVREAIAALRAQPAVASLTLNPQLSQAARDQVVDQSRTGNTGHTGSDGSSTNTRVARYATWRISLSENIDYGPFHAGREVVENLIVDDGVANRGHRRNIYDATARVVGIACGPHPKYGASCVIVQAGGISAK